MLSDSEVVRPLLSRGAWPELSCGESGDRRELLVGGGEGFNDCQTSTMGACTLTIEPRQVRHATLMFGSETGIFFQIIPISRLITGIPYHHRKSYVKLKSTLK